MKNLEQINKQFEEIASKVNEYARYVELQKQCLEQPTQNINTKMLLESRDYIMKHKDSIKQVEQSVTKEWKKICMARTFDYEELGQMIAETLTQVESVPYFYATRLVKHHFQVDEDNRPFYRIVSFVTSNPSDLEQLILERLTGTMIPYYAGVSPIMKPLPTELETTSKFEQMIRKELEARTSTDFYVSTNIDIRNSLAFRKPENQISLKKFPYHYINDMINECITRKYYDAFTKEEFFNVVTELKSKTIKPVGMKQG